MLKQPIYYEFNLDARTSPSKLIAISHVDDRYSEIIEVALMQNGRHIYMGGATVIARMVLHRDKDYLLSDDVTCSVNANGNILIPFDNAVVKTLQGVVKIEVNITRDTDELTLQFPLWVSVTGSILDNAEVTPESEGTIPDLLKDAADALEDAKEALGSYAEVVHEITEARGTYTTLHDAITAKLDDTDGSVKENNIADESITVEKVADDLAEVINAKEAKSNKKTTLTGNESSNDFYPTTKAVADALEVVQAEIDSVKVDTPFTYLFSRTNSLKNGATSTDGIVTIPSGQTGNQTYLGIRTFEMSSIKGLTLKFSVPFEVSDSILSNMTPVVLTNGTGVTTKSITFSNNVVNAVIDVPSDTTATYVLVVLKLVNTTALSNDATIALGDYVVTKSSTVEEGVHTIIDENLSENSDLSALEEMKKTELTEYFSLASSALDGATVSGNVLTVPSGQKGNQAYIGIRVLAHIDRVKGHTFDVSIPATISSNLAGAKTKILMQVNGTGATVNSSSWDGVTAKANITIADNATSTYVVAAVKIVNSSAFTETATITIGDYNVTETVTLQNGIANLLGSGRFYGKKMSCFGDSYTSQEGWQPKTKEILGLASYSNVAIYGGVLTTGYAGIQNVDTDSNILTILYGTNDYSNNMPLGTIEDDATSPTTFYGALKYVFEWVSTNLPKCLIVPMTHTQRWASAKDLEFIANNGYGTGGQPKNNLGYSLLDYANAIIDVANRYGYKVLDFNRFGQVNKNNEGSFYGSDHLHPSATSYILLGNKIAKFIQQE
ncbi:MAG: SGNH/GDSL hydrolase family protein [Ruminococcus sp.]|nr:SGNH/GDSL hydrolase family protein [Ruminococcus sp.]